MAIVIGSKGRSASNRAELLEDRCACSPFFDEQPQWHETPSSHALFAESSSSSVPTHALIAGLRQKHDDRLQIIDNLP